jgi:carboxylate-amine ligase
MSVSDLRGQREFPARFEETHFRGSPEMTIGVELELQILDRDTGDLVPGAQRILDACREDGIDRVSGEFLLSMIEVRTGVCRDVADVRDDLFSTLKRVRNIAASLGFDLALGGTHPFARPSASAVSPDVRYQRIRKRQAWLAYQEATFGVHVHVGVPGGDIAIGLVNHLVQYIPHMLALSANSPFWQGIDTGFASSRAMMFRPSPHAGMPPQFSGWKDFCEYGQILCDCGAIEATKDLHWDIRPRPATGTIEIRIFDTPGSLGYLLGLAALARALVAEGIHLLAGRPKLIPGDWRKFVLATENRWRAARFGLRAQCVRDPRKPLVVLAEDTRETISRLEAVADNLADGEFLDALTYGGESGAECQRRIYRQAGDWQPVIDNMKSGWAAELQTAATYVDEQTH